MAKKKTLTEEEVIALCAEREELNKWVDPPKPDPAQWPPEGYAVHPENPALLYRVVSSADLFVEMFGSDEKKEYLKTAAARIKAIDKILTPYFFPDLKQEGTQHATKAGFKVVVAPSIERAVDVYAAEDNLENCPDPEAAKEAIDWKATIRLKQYRALSEENKAQFDEMVTEKPKPAPLTIVRISE